MTPMQPPNPTPGFETFKLTSEVPAPRPPQGASQGAKPCNSCGQAARLRREAQRAKRDADQAAKDLT